MSQIEFYKPTIKRRDMDAVLQTMVDEKIGPGEKRSAFCASLCTLTGKKSAAAFRTMKDAVETAFSLLQLKSGSRVAVSPLTPSIYAKAAAAMGIELVICDIDPENCCIDFESVCESGCDAAVLFEPFCTIPYGRPFKDCPVPVIEDISQSIGSRYEDEIAGSYSDICICMLEDDNLISAAGGAFVAVSTEESANALALSEDRFLSLPDLNCALGLVQLSTFEERLLRRKEIFRAYRQSLIRTSHKPFGFSNIDFDANAGYFCVLLDGRPADTVKFAQRYQVPVKKCFDDCVGTNMADDFEHIPNSVPYLLRTVSFPIYPFLTSSEAQIISKVISHI